VLLIVEDDPHYAGVLVDLRARTGSRCSWRCGARSAGIGARVPPAAISLDVFLPDMLGWTVLSQLKQEPATRHIPVQIVTLDEDRQHGLDARRIRLHEQADHDRWARQGFRQAEGLSEPRRRQLLLVEDNEGERLSVTELLGHDDIDITSVATGARRARN
jgi:CheY-like chemotaxis protein